MFIGLFISLVVSAASKEPDWIKFEARAAEVTKGAKCEAMISAEGSCLRAVMDEEADGFLTGRIYAFAERLVTDMPTKPREFLLLKGISFQSLRPSVPDRCLALLGLGVTKKRKQKGESPCLYSAVMVDFGRWGRHEKSLFGDAVTAALEKYRNYRSNLGFQQTRWGMTPAEVASLYPNAVRQSNGDFVEKGSVADLDATIRLLFIDERLWSAVVEFAADDTQPDEDVQRTMELRTLLSKKYGKPVIKDGSPSGKETPLDKALRDNAGLGRAVRGGRMRLQATWASKEMEIELTLGSSARSLYHRLTYRSVVFAGRATEKNEEARASGL